MRKRLTVAAVAAALTALTALSAATTARAELQRATVFVDGMC